MKRFERKNFALALCGISFAVAASAEAQQTKKIPRIGYFSSTDSSAASDRSAPFRQALRELGYIEGENIAIEYRYAEHERQRAHAAELVRLPVDVIFATSTPRLLTS